MMMDCLSQECFKYQQVDLIVYQNELKPVAVWKVGKTLLIHHSSSMLWEMIVSNVTCMKIEYIKLKCAKWLVWSFKVEKKDCSMYGNDCWHSIHMQTK
ncbi:hypothetical protein LDENG_00224650 [Lucifuga dentata]|nr:hypothetical protein LDENG_00224650 [Lucifuga dentata]